MFMYKSTTFQVQNIDYPHKKETEDAKNKHLPFYHLTTAIILPELVQTLYLVPEKVKPLQVAAHQVELRQN